MSTTMLPKFRHDCDRCTFLGHYAGHDVYTCAHAPGNPNKSLLARYGDDGPEYYSNDLATFMRSIECNLRYTDATVTPHVDREATPTPYQLAWLMALAHQYIVEEVMP
jgi:hypothetical protein